MTAVRLFFFFIMLWIFLLIFVANCAQQEQMSTMTTMQDNLAGFLDDSIIDKDGSLVGDNSNSTHTQESFPPRQQRALLITKAVLASLSFSATFCYLCYVLVRSVYTFPWISVFKSCCCLLSHVSFSSSSTSNSSSTVDLSSDEHSRSSSRESLCNRRLWKKITSQCYILSKPVTRILVCVQISECLDDSQVMIEVFNLARYNVLCIYQAVVFQYFGFAKISWSFMVSVWMIWILVFRKTRNLFM